MALVKGNLERFHFNLTLQTALPWINSVCAVCDKEVGRRFQKKAFFYVIFELNNFFFFKNWKKYINLASSQKRFRDDEKTCSLLSVSKLLITLHNKIDPSRTVPTLRADHFNNWFVFFTDNLQCDLATHNFTETEGIVIIILYCYIGIVGSSFVFNYHIIIHSLLTLCVSDSVILYLHYTHWFKLQNYKKHPSLNFINLQGVP